VHVYVISCNMNGVDSNMFIYKQLMLVFNIVYSHFW